MHSLILLLKKWYRNNSDQIPLSFDDNSISNNTDYAHSGNYIHKSPDRLRILKSTLRTNTVSSENNINKFLSIGFKQQQLKNNFTETENSVSDGSVFNSSLKKELNISSLTTPIKDSSIIKQKFHTEKKGNNTENRYSKLK